MKLKKPKFWDYPKPNFLSNLLFPFSKFYELILKINKKKPSKIENIKTICVGNIYIGGTGKTSFAIELMKIFNEQKIKACFIKKYHSDQLDEQEILRKFGKTFIYKSRLDALREAVKQNFAVAIFDDGLQDKNINYDVSFVCFNEKNIYGNGRIIPSGPLRESLNNVVKYKNIMFTGNQIEISLDKKHFLKYSDYCNFYNSKYKPQNLSDFDLKQNYLVFSGIGNHETFIDMLLKNNFNIVKDLEYPDHYNYLKKDIDKMINIAKNYNAKILTTEKDYVRLQEDFKKDLYFIKVNLEIYQLDKIKKEIKFLYEDN